MISVTTPHLNAQKLPLAKKPLNQEGSSQSVSKPFESGAKQKVSFGNYWMYKYMQNASPEEQESMAIGSAIALGALALGAGLYFGIRSVSHEHLKTDVLVDLLGAEKVEQLDTWAKNAQAKADSQDLNAFKYFGYVKHDFGGNYDNFDPAKLQTDLDAYCRENSVVSRKGEDDFYQPSTVFAVPELDEFHQHKGDGHFAVDGTCYGVKVEPGEYIAPTTLPTQQPTTPQQAQPPAPVTSPQTNPVETQPSMTLEETQQELQRTQQELEALKQKLEEQERSSDHPL